MDQVALGQFIGETAGDQLQLVFVVLPRVDAKPAFRAAKRRLDQRAFIGHQRRQRFDFVLIDASGIADAALHRFHMFGMHRAVADEGLDLAAQPDPEAHGIGRVANPDFLFQPGRQIHQRHRAVEHQIYGLTKTWLGNIRHDLSLFSLAPRIVWALTS